MYTLADLEDADSGHYGLKGSPTQVERIFPPDKNDEKRIFDGTGEELAADIAKLLVARKFIV
jgi:electron transfer flavoprotein beta subunit